MGSSGGGDMDGGFVGDPEETGSSRQGLQRAIDLLEEQRREGMHAGAQLFVARRGRILVDAAIGEASAGIPMKTDSVLLWFSATKPLTSVAIAQLWEQGKLELNDPVRKFIPEFGNGKEAATIKHLLTHTGGFRMRTFPVNYDWDTAIQKICEEPAEWEPGTVAGYHMLTGWYILGEIVGRIDGRRIDRYIEDEVLRPLGMKDTTLSITPAREAELGGRLSVVTETIQNKTGLESWNETEYHRYMLPAGTGWGPAHDYGRLFLALQQGGILQGERILKSETVDLFTTTHRRDMVDRTFSAREKKPVSPPWGLGFRKGSDEPIVAKMGRMCTADAYGHGGNRCMVGFAEPSRELVVAIVTNGLPAEDDNVKRLCAVSDAIHTACRKQASYHRGCTISTG